MDELVANLRRGLPPQHRPTLDWMTDETKERAFGKLGTFRPKIGYPEQVPRLLVDRRACRRPARQLRRGRGVRADRQLGKIGAPVDRDEWLMTPQTVNAYYNPGINEICFPAAILQPPFFDADADAAENYGGIGAVIGHEIGHGFDDQGSEFDERRQPGRAGGPSRQGGVQRARPTS